ncbi:MAG: SusC/RagA family TonB-linked outer membrane protein [Flavobacteriaceae bacterium]
MKRILSLFVLNLFFVSGLWAQQTSVNGTVTDESGLPLPGATIIVENSNRGVTTDFDGNFTINAQAGEVLVISYVGYQDSRITVGNETSYTISLQTDAALEEVIVTGYSSYRKSEVTGSTVQLSQDQLTQLTLPTVDQALQGRVAGLTISANSGTPGSTSQIRIRGISSITAGNEPLYVIDGVPVTNGNVSNSTASSFFSSLAGIDNNNIKSVTVLKDAASTAQYGASGANGVILITTKSGTSGDTVFNFNSYYGVQNDATDGPLMLTAAQRLDLFAEGLHNDNPSTYASIDAARNFIVNNVRAYRTWDAAGRPEANWAEKITNKDAPIEEYSFSASGGDDKSTFFASMGYMKQEATVIASTFDRISGSLNISRFLNDKIRFSSSNSFSVSNQDGILERSAYFEGPRTVKFFGPPLLEPYTDEGEINEFGGALPNPLYIAKYNINRSKLTRIISNSNVEIDLIDNLTFGSRFNVDYQIFHRKTFSDRNYGYGASNSGELFDVHRNTVTYVLQNYLDYSWALSDQHNFDFKLLQEYQQNKRYFMSAEGHNFPDDGLHYLDSAGSPIGVNSNFTDWYVGAYLFTTHYSGMNGKYVADLSYRREGNSRFNENNRWGDFWSVGVAWNMHREAFMESVDFVNSLKFRASYGVTGNANIRLNQYQSLFAYDADYATEGAQYADTFGNNDLSWETSNTVDIAIDFGLFNNSLTGSLGYYKRVSNDLLLNVPLSLTTGFDSQIQNIGSLKNSGLEVELQANLISSNDLNLSIGGNIGTNANEVTELAKDANGEYRTIQDSRTKVDVGHRTYAWFLPTWAGVNPDNGDEEFYINGIDGEKTTVFNDAEQVFQGGNAVPTLTGGINFHIDYKGFYMDATGYFAGGHKVYEGWHRYINNNYSGFSVQYYNGFASLLTDAWRNPGDQTRNGKISARTIPWQSHSKYLHDGDFARLRVLTFGYQLPNNWLNQLRLTQAQIYLRGNNLLTWQKAKDQPYDPEVDLGRVGGNGVVDPGGQTGLETPPVQSFIIGLNFNF